jgi:hypothetical protein
MKAKLVIKTGHVTVAGVGNPTPESLQSRGLRAIAAAAGFSGDFLRRGLTTRMTVTIHVAA